MVAGRMFRPMCDDCCEERNRKVADEAAAARLATTISRFNEIASVYPGYHPDETKWSRISPEASDAAKDWMVRPDKARGLWFCGRSGSGKTRTIFGMMQRIAEAGQLVGYSPHNQLCDVIAGSAMRDAEATRTMEQLKRADILVIDDLGKGRATDAATLGLYGLVEHFTSKQKPMIVTSQAAGAWMEARFNDDAGAAIVRRLSEFCEIVNLK
jgi:DNA replication protein DnaC